MRTYLTGLTVVWVMVASACAIGVDEESAMPPKPPRLDGSTGAYGGESGFGGGGAAGWTPAGGEGGSAGIPAAAGFGASGGATGGEGGIPPAAGFGGGGAGGGVNCNPGEVQDLGACGMCGNLQKVCNASGSWDTPACIDQGVCTANEVEDAPCGSCGTKSRTCTSACIWGAFSACQNQGCAPGDTEDCLCSTLGSTTSCCGQRVCNNNCEWGACGLKPTSACDWDAGTTYYCCGAGKWEYCLSNCQWSGNCASCSGCSC